MHSVFRYGGEFAELVIERAEGTYIYSADGRPILDFTSGQMSGILGHSHPEIVDAVRQGVGSLDHLHSSFLSSPALELASDLAAICPGGLDKVLPLSTGGESNEAAIKMAKMVTQGFEIVGFDRAWHGVTGGAGASTYNGGRKGYGPTMPGSLTLPTPDAYRSPFKRGDAYHWQEELDYGFATLDRQSVGAYAAVLVEPILSSAGIIELPPGYLRALQDKCRQRGMMLILDEAQTGLGRTGDLLACDHEGVVPDILTLSKTLGAGLPLSAVVTTDEIEATCFERGYLFYTTHAADPLPAMVGRKVVEIVLRDQLSTHAREMGTYFKGQLKSLQQDHAVIGDVRGRGLLLGIELVTDPETKEPAAELGFEVSKRCLELGACLNISRRSVASVFRIAPPLTVTRDQIDTAVAILDQALKEYGG